MDNIGSHLYVASKKIARTKKEHELMSTKNRWVVTRGRDREVYEMVEGG